MGKDVAKYAALGLVAGFVLPFARPLVGAALGASYAVYKNRRRETPA